MHLVLLSRTFALPSLGGTAERSARVSLLQDTDTLRKTWEVAVIVRTSRRVVIGATSRKPTRTAAMRLVRQMLYSS